MIEIEDLKEKLDKEKMTTKIVSWKDRQIDRYKDGLRDR